MIKMAMSELITDYKDLQDEIDKLEKGVCFACRLVNYDETRVYKDQDKHFIIEDLDQIIEEDVSKNLIFFQSLRKIKRKI